MITTRYGPRADMGIFKVKKHHLNLIRCDSKTRNTTHHETKQEKEKRGKN